MPGDVHACQILIILSKWWLLCDSGKPCPNPYMFRNHSSLDLTSTNWNGLSGRLNISRFPFPDGAGKRWSLSSYILLALCPRYCPQGRWYWTWALSGLDCSQAFWHLSHSSFLQFHFPIILKFFQTKGIVFSSITFWGRLSVRSNLNFSRQCWTC